jgi:lysozyme family protein
LDKPDRLPDVQDFIEHILASTASYMGVETATNVPWYIVGIIHGMECSFDFNTHLHNGDPLTKRTVQEPAGRPPASVGDPPFAWKTSAIDALQYDRFTVWDEWDVAGICYKLEGYNGWGYRKHNVNSPYLWSFSSNYSCGKYIADGLWNGSAVSKQVGAITALKQMVTEHYVALPAHE